MKITVVQTDLIWENKSANLRNLEKILTPSPDKTDLVILPEMFNTGFSMTPSSLAEAMAGETSEWMTRMASEGNFGICGSYIIEEKGRFYNRWRFIGPNSESYHYDKRHLFSMGGEDKHFSAGVAPLIFNFRDFRISPYICYDLRFPVWSRNIDKYDLAIYAANWPEARINVWNTLLQARAIENQCFVAGCNRIGIDGKDLKYNGMSQIVNPKGEVSKSAGSGECCITADLSLSELRDFRNKFSVFNDADNYEIKL